MGYNVPTGLAGIGTGAKVGSLIMPGIGTGLGAAIGALAGLFGGGGDTDPTKNLDLLFQKIPELRQLLTLQSSQAQRSDPLHAALVQLSMNLLPKSARAPYAGVPSAVSNTPWQAAPSGVSSSFQERRLQRLADGALKG
jgi:hypothetical protein